MTASSSLRLLQLFFTLLVINSSFSSAIGRQNQNETFYNPAIPGWHSDPSCVFVAERDNTTFCTSSTFLLTPGLPVHASKDLKNWKLASHAISRKSQLPDYESSSDQADGIWAPTIRFHQGNFYIITMYRNNVQDQGTILVFKTTDPYSDSAWSDPIRHINRSIDPDIFWDQDGTTYTVDLKTGNFSEARSIWNGTSGVSVEGPHIYRKDGYYYLLAAEGGSGLNHSAIIARSKDIYGPYESNPANPVLTNSGTEEYFQNIGHADLFRDAQGQWWSAALGWRSGPEAVTYPMGRETVISPVTWNDGEFPIFTPLRGVESAWTISESQYVPGDGPFVTHPDIVDFCSNSTIPRHFGYWRWPDEQAYKISPLGHPGTLQLTPSTASISASATNLTAGYEIANYTLMMRLQTHTLFQYSVDISYAPQAKDEEAGVTVFLNPVQNMVLGIVILPTNTTGNSTLRNSLAPHFRFMVSGLGSLVREVPPPVIMPVPDSWL
ncbi:hypothetical protein EAE96_010763 [Botrytis aclada]|nr:hypothetical protein EAE96_010763 [Botrytis aclada]